MNQNDKPIYISSSILLLTGGALLWECAIGAGDYMNIPYAGGIFTAVVVQAVVLAFWKFL